MARVTVAQQNFSGGELSPALSGRFDLSIYYNGASWLQNFIATTQGMAAYRSGTKFVWNTRDNAEALLVPFEYNTEQAYVLEFTENKIRIIKDGGIVTATGQDITGITQANPAVVTYSGADTYANGDRVVISGVVGMIEVNDQEFTVANVNAGANTFELSGIDSTTYAAYSSGGSVAEIIEVTTTYGAAELLEIDYAQTNDTLYLVHPDHAPAKLTRSSHTSWALADVTFQSNPFGTTKAASQAISGATAANPVVVTYGGTDTYANGDTVYIDGVVGMTQLNKRNYTVANVNAGANTFELQGVDGTSYTAYSSGGTIEEYTAFSYPSKVTFFERRLIYAASDSYPQTIWGSVGASYDNFLTGTAADDSFKYTLSSGQANRIRWMAGTEDFLAIGTAGAEFKAEGGTNEPITPTNISIKPPSYYGSADIKPIRLDSHILYITRDKITSRTFEFDAIQDGFTSINRNLTSDRILRGRYGMDDGVRQVAFQSGNRAINWMVRNDGIMVGLTFEPREQVNGWHRHIAGGSYSDGKQNRPEYISLATISQETGPDQLYVVVKRTIDGQTVNYIEYFVDQPNIPLRNDYYTGPDNEDDDEDAFLIDMYEAQKRLWYLDCALSFDGTVNQTGALSGTTVGEGRVFTAGGATFSADDVDDEIHGKAGGIAIITGYTSSTVVTVEIVEEFPSASIASGEWYLTFDTLTGLSHLNGETLSAVADGGLVENIDVTNGVATLPTTVSYVIIGLPYLGMYQSMDIEGGGENGPGVTKNKGVTQVGVRLLETGYCRIGTDPYKLSYAKLLSTDNITGRPAPLESGVVMVGVEDSIDNEKYIYCVQDKPFPCNLQILSPRLQTNDG